MMMRMPIAALILGLGLVVPSRAEAQAGALAAPPPYKNCVWRCLEWTGQDEFGPGWGCVNLGGWGYGESCIATAYQCTTRDCDGESEISLFAPDGYPVGSLQCGELTLARNFTAEAASRTGTGST